MSQIQNYLECLAHEVTEVRILRSDRYLAGNGKRAYTGVTVSGYYEREAYGQIANDIQALDQDPGTKAIYNTLQAVKPDLLARAKNRLKLNATVTTGDHEIVAFTAFPIDIDPERPSGISSSDEELEASRARAREIMQALLSIGVPENAVIKAMSGNGCHLIVLINPLVNTPEFASLFKSAGDIVSVRFKTDQTIYNPARIFKLYGTFSRKGDDTEERPHRKSIVELPDTVERMDFAKLHELVKAEFAEQMTATSVPSPKTKTASAPPVATTGEASTSPLEQWLDKNGVTHKGGNVRGAKRYKEAVDPEKPGKKLKEGWKYRVDCPHNASHINDGVVVFWDDGTHTFKCSHNSCQNDRETGEGPSTWKAFTAALGIKSPAVKSSGRPSNASVAKNLEVPDEIASLPVVNLQEILTVDGKDAIADRHRHEVSDDVVKHLWRSSRQEVYRRGKEIGTLRDSEEGLLFEPSTPKSMPGIISRAVSLVKYGEGGRLVTIANPPNWLGDDVRENQDIRGVRQVKAVLSHPFWNGEAIVATDGYDAETEVYLRMDQAYDLDTSVYTAESDVALWKELLSDFPFKDESDFQNAIAAMLTLIIRQGLQIGECPPLIAISAPREGVGKSLLADVLMAAVLGRQPQAESLSSNTDEVPKQIGASLREAPEVILFDNVDPRKPLDCAELASVATQPKRTYRILGQSGNMRVENRATILYTGSNVEVTAEIVKRLMFIRLSDTGVAEKDRKVKIQGLLDHTLKNREALLGSLLRMVKRWIDTGSPEGENTHRMRQWSRVVGGILNANGLGEAFLANTDETMLDANPEFTMWTNAFKAIVDVLGEEKAESGWTVHDVFRILSYEDTVYAHEKYSEGRPKNVTRIGPGDNLLGEVLKAQSERGRKTQLAGLLRKRAGAVYAGWELFDTHQSTRKGKKVFCLKRREGAYIPDPGDQEADTPDTERVDRNGYQRDSTEASVLEFMDGRSVECQEIVVGVMEITGYEEEDAKMYLKGIIDEGKLKKFIHEGAFHYRIGSA